MVPAGESRNSLHIHKVSSFLSAGIEHGQCPPAFWIAALISFADSSSAYF